MLMLATGPIDGAALFRVDGGAPVRTHIRGAAEVGWSGDAKHFVLERGALTLRNSYVFSLTRGQAVPEVLLRGFPSEQELAKLPGVWSIPSTDVALGPTVDTYAFTRQSVQRNLYRVPLP
jgi:hypothetical protein